MFLDDDEDEDIGSQIEQLIQRSMLIEPNMYGFAEKVYNICKSQRMNLHTDEWREFQQKEPWILCVKMFYAYYEDYLRRLLTFIDENGIKDNKIKCQIVSFLSRYDWENPSEGDIKLFIRMPNKYVDLDFIGYNFVQGTCWSYGDIRGTVKVTYEEWLNKQGAEGK